MVPTNDCLGKRGLAVQDASVCASTEMLLFLSSCLKHGVSLCIAGPPGSGKAELIDLLESLVPSETGVDGINIDDINTAEESSAACEDSCSGQSKYITVRANSSTLAYLRLATLAGQCVRAHGSTLMQMMIAAFPVVAFTKRLADGKWRVVEIIEGECADDGSLRSHTLYRFKLHDNETNGKNVIVSGQHQNAKRMSESLRQRFLENGASIDEIGKLATGVNNYHY